jgi:hypothetical protein
LGWRSRNISEALKEINFVLLLLPAIEFEFKVGLPIVGEIDNVGALCMSQNSFRSRTVDTHYHVMWKIESMKVEFVKSRDNDYDIFTKSDMRKRF